MRNGRIELLRFFYCMAVVLYHLQADLNIDQEAFGPYFSFFLHGRGGVEFFFIISGVFMAKHALRLQGGDTLPGMDTMSFMAGKIRKVYAPYLICIALMCIYIAVYINDPVKVILRKMPSLFFLQETGIWNENFIFLAWYVSSMLIGVALIFPFLRVRYDFTARAVAPILSILMIGYLIENYGALPNRPHFTIVDPSVLRAVAILLLGVTVFEISCRMKEHHIPEILGKRLVALELVCYAISFFYLTSNLTLKLDGVAALITAAGVAITLSREPSKLMNSRFIYFLGDISLSVYLSQNIVRLVMMRMLDDSDMGMKPRLILELVLIICLGIAVHYAAKGLTMVFGRWYGSLKTKYAENSAAASK